jgi:plastocyanin
MSAVSNLPLTPSFVRRGSGGGYCSPFVVLLSLFLATPALPADIAGRVQTSDGRPLEDAVVFVRELPSGVVAEEAERTAVMDQVNKEFVPHVLPVVVGTRVRFPNHDQIHHHVYSFSRTKIFEIPLYKGEEAEPVVFDQEGAVKIGCNIHDWMSAVILVLPNPFFAATGADGGFRISGLPPGHYVIAVWHERSETPLGETAREIESGSEAEVVFSFDVRPARERPGAHGMRKYE